MESTVPARNPAHYVAALSAFALAALGLCFLLGVAGSIAAGWTRNTLQVLVSSYSKATTRPNFQRHPAATTNVTSVPVTGATDLVKLLLQDQHKHSAKNRALHYGDLVTLRSDLHRGALLHSHPHNYPEGSRQQQVTVYPYHDENNQWIILPGPVKRAGPKQLVKDGSVIRLMHVTTKKFLHSHHGFTAPLSKTKNEQEVTGFGSPMLSDKNDLWLVEIMNTKSKDGHVHVGTTHFVLRHLVTNCLLSTSGQPLPSWGYGQGQVFCHHPAKKDNENGKTEKDQDIDKFKVEFEHLWHIESHVSGNASSPEEQRRLK